MFEIVEVGILSSFMSPNFRIYFCFIWQQQK